MTDVARGMRPEAASPTPLVFPPVEELPDQEGLPDPFVGADGERIRSVEEWPAQREYLKALLRHYLHGHMPPRPDGDQVAIEQTRSRPAFDDMAVEEHYTLTLSRNGRDVDLDIALFRPAVAGRCPAVIKNCFHQFDMPSAADSAVMAAGVPLAPIEAAIQTDRQAARDAVGRGYLLCKFQREQLARDDRNDSPSGVQLLYPECDWGAITVWAWGHSIVLDALERLGYVDMNRTVATGVSRGGQAAMAAGIFDERHAIVAPCAGNIAACGTVRVHDPDGAFGKEDLLTTVYRDMVPHWFTPRFHEFAGRKDKLPFDAHTLVALVAPRAVLNTNATEDPFDNTLSIETGIRVGQKVYDWMDRGDWCRLHWRPGTTHGQFAEDWRALLDYSDECFFGRTTGRAYNQWVYPDFTPPVSWTAPSALGDRPGDSPGAGDSAGKGRP